MPYYLIPGDLLFLSPLYFISPERYQNMAVVAGNGGLIPWQSGMATRIGRFQFILGRELGMTFYGLLGNDRVIASSVSPGGPERLIEYKSILFDMPIVEYRPIPVVRQQPEHIAALPAFRRSRCSTIGERRIAGG